MWWGSPSNGNGFQNVTIQSCFWLPTCLEKTECLTQSLWCQSLPLWSDWQKPLSITQHSTVVYNLTSQCGEVLLISFDLWWWILSTGTQKTENPFFLLFSACILCLSFKAGVVGYTWLHWVSVTLTQTLHSFCHTYRHTKYVYGPHSNSSMWVIEVTNIGERVPEENEEKVIT